MLVDATHFASSKNDSYLKHNNIHYILKKLWISFKQILPV